MTISYESALELKKAGYPQGNVLAGKSLEFKDGELHIEGEPVYVPTLSELVEACLPDFRSLTYHTDGTWEVWLGRRAEDESRPKNHAGLTPEEAVARLWLALHKKPE